MLQVYKRMPFFPPKPRDGGRVGSRVWHAMSRLGWRAELKLDGIRMLVHVEQGRVSATSRTGLVQILPGRTREVMELLPDGDYDGEFYEGELWLFDMPSLSADWDTRRATLVDTLIQTAVHHPVNGGVCLVPLAFGSPDDVWRAVEAVGAEGVVLKNPKSMYQRVAGPDSPPITDWLKFKKAPKGWESQA